MKYAVRTIFAGLTVLIVSAVPAEAQRHKARVSDDRYYNRWSLEPYAGAFRDAYDLTFTETGYLVGVRVGYLLGSRWRLQGNVGYNETENVAYSPIPITTQYNNEWVMTTAGAEFDVVPGRTAGSIGVNAGVGWRRVRLDDESSLPGPGQNLATNGFASYEVVVPSLSLRHRLSTRAAVTLRFEDYMFDVFDGPTDHSLALSLGLAFR